jgi:C4-dicarboxylate-specific signal transduction histidine kinase
MKDDVILFGCFRLAVAEGLLEHSGSVVKSSTHSIDTIIALLEDAARVDGKRDMLDWSRLLSEREWIVLGRLAMFDGTLTLERARSVASLGDSDEGETVTVVRNPGDISAELGQALSERGDNAVGARARAAASYAIAKELCDLRKKLKQVEGALREAERRNIDAQIQLAHTNRIATMGRLAASIAHEVNQPVGATLMSAETALRWLAASPPNLDSARQSLDRIITDGKRVADIIGLIRDLAKKAPARKEGLEINRAILDVIELTRNEMARNGVLVQTRLTDSLPRVWGNRIQLQQVILNLIMNAIEAMSELSEGSRALLISTDKAEADRVLVTVSDSGPGLPQANPDRVFEAFYTTKAGGLGIGLPICRSIAEVHGGRLWAAPNEPHGAVFSLTLPVEQKGA